MLIGVLCPAGTASGRLGAVREKYLVEAEALLIVTDVVPEFVAVTVRVLLLPAVTLPKSTLRLPKEREPVCCWPEPAALTPWQPTRQMRTAKSSNALAASPKYLAEDFLARFLCIIFANHVPPNPLLIWMWGMAQHQSGACDDIELDFGGTETTRRTANRNELKVSVANFNTAHSRLNARARRCRDGARIERHQC